MEDAIQWNPAPAEVYAKITARMIELMDRDGLAPWVRPWRSPSGGGSPFPVNGRTGRAYNGINICLLNAAALDRKFHHNEWWTRKQIDAVKGSVHPGEKPQEVLFAFPLVIDPEGQVVKDPPEGDELPEGWRKAFATILHQVFNRDQCDDLPPPRFSGPPLPDLDPIERAESLINRNKNLPNIHHRAQVQAYYSPALDAIVMPQRGQFKGQAEYYSTLFHEATHSTGHKSRLNRRTITEMGKFGDENYSKEELTAEMGAAFLCALADIENIQATMNSAAYLKHWRQKLKDDPRLIVDAAAAASKASDFIVDGAPAWDGAMPARNETTGLDVRPAEKPQEISPIVGLIHKNYPIEQRDLGKLTTSALENVYRGTDGSLGFHLTVEQATAIGAWWNGKGLGKVIGPHDVSIPLWVGSEVELPVPVVDEIKALGDLRELARDLRDTLGENVPVSGTMKSDRYVNDEGMPFSYKKRVNAGRWVDAAKRVGIAPGELDRVALALELGKPMGNNRAARFVRENIDLIRQEARERENTLYGDAEYRQPAEDAAVPVGVGEAGDLGNDGLPDWVTSNPRRKAVKRAQVAKQGRKNRADMTDEELAAANRDQEIANRIMPHLQEDGGKGEGTPAWVDSNPSRHELVGLGRLLRLVVRDPKTGKREAFEPETVRFLAWDLRRGDLAVAHPTVQGRTAKPGQAVAAAHARFHGSDPRGSVAVEIPARGKRVRRLGLLESLTYQPIGWPSNKARNPWMHQFGDVGERGHGKADPDAVSPYPEGLMPWACVDAAGALFIERRPGNQYEVTDWIMA